MSYLETRGDGRMGAWASALTAVLGPVVEGGAAAYGVYASDKQSKRELKQRQAEYQQQLEEEEKARQAQERQYMVAQQAAIQQAQIARAYAERSWPYVVAVVGLGALALITVVGVKAAKRRKARAS